MKFIAVWVAMLPALQLPGGERGVDVGVGGEVDDLDARRGPRP